MASILLSKEGRVLSYAAVPRSICVSRGCQPPSLLTACGISCMATHPDFRGRGYGTAVFKAATAYMRKAGTTGCGPNGGWRDSAAGTGCSVPMYPADFGVFTCDPPLRRFYERFGWRIAPAGACLVGGTRELPFSSADLGKLTLIRYFSERAKAARLLLESGPLYIELGEGKLW